MPAFESGLTVFLSCLRGTRWMFEAPGMERMMCSFIQQLKILSAVIRTVAVDMAHMLGSSQPPAKFQGYYPTVFWHVDLIGRQWVPTDIDHHISMSFNKMFSSTPKGILRTVGYSVSWWRYTVNRVSRSAWQWITPKVSTSNDGFFNYVSDLSATTFTEA